MTEVGTAVEDGIVDDFPDAKLETDLWGDSVSIAGVSCLAR